MAFYARTRQEMPKIDKELLFVIDENNNSVDMTDKGIDMITEMVHDKEFYNARFGYRFKCHR